MNFETELIEKVSTNVALYQSILLMLQGDSGGPLQILVKDPYCMYRVAGITSFGVKCGQNPSVYTRVTDFLEWIEDKVWPDEPRRRGKGKRDNRVI